MKICFETLGCKVNMFETQALQQLAIKRGHTLAYENADAAILNTCAVTSASEHKCIRALHTLKRRNPNAVIAVCGCFSEITPERLSETGEVDIICGTKNRQSVIERCENAFHGQCDIECSSSNSFEFLSAGVPDGRTRALLKIQDGCDNYCTYCIIPYARGHIRSMHPDDVLSEIERLRDNGVHEIVLTGIEIASYGRDINVSFLDVLEQALERAPQVRFRLSSLEPRIVTDEFCVRLSQHTNLAQHFHLSLQSGCDAVLKRMGRRYSTKTYYENVCRLNHFFPNCTLTTDIIVGFCGETEEEFQSSMAFVQQCGLANVHVFPYSSRSGTAAASFPDLLTHTQKECRANTARKIAEELSVAAREKIIGKPARVILEHMTKDSVWSGHADLCFPIYIAKQDAHKNDLISVRITGLYRDGLSAEAFPLQNQEIKL